MLLWKTEHILIFVPGISRKPWERKAAAQQVQGAGPAETRRLRSVKTSCPKTQQQSEQIFKHLKNLKTLSLKTGNTEKLSDLKKENCKSSNVKVPFFKIGTRSNSSPFRVELLTTLLLHFGQPPWQLPQQRPPPLPPPAGKGRSECESDTVFNLQLSRSHYSVNCICCIIRLYKMLSAESAKWANGNARRPRPSLPIGPHQCWNLIYKGDFFENSLHKALLNA